MAKIQLVSGFARLEEGDHIMEITDVNYKEKFGKMEVHMKSRTTGTNHIERFGLKKDDGSWNTGAQTAFTWFARNVLNDNDLEVVDTDDLIGVQFTTTVTHVVSTYNDKEYTNVRMDDRVGLGNTPSADSDDVEEIDELDLDDLLG